MVRDWREGVDACSLLATNALQEVCPGIPTGLPLPLQGALDPGVHGPIVYRALASSLSAPDAGDDIATALELSKVFTLASKHGQV